MSTQNVTEAQAVAVDAVKAKVAELTSKYGDDSIGLDELAEKLEAEQIATEVIYSGRWYEDVLNVLLMPNGSFVGVITKSPLTEKQEFLGADSWQVVPVEGTEKVVTAWSVVK